MRKIGILLVCCLAATCSGDSTRDVTTPPTVPGDSLPSAPVSGPSIFVAVLSDHATGAPINASKVSGLMDARAAHDVPPTALYNAVIQFQLNKQAVCTFPIMAQQGTDTCTIDTSRFPNGSSTFRVIVVRADGVILASATAAPFTISN